MAHAYFGEGSLMELKRQALRAKAQAESVVEKIDSGVLAITEGAEVAAAAFAFGVANGKVGGQGLRVPFVGLPADLAFGVVVHGVAFLSGMKEERARHYRALANGALGSYFSTLGAQVGLQWKTTGGLLPGMSASKGDDDDTTGGGALADEELARMVRPAT